MKMDFIIVEWPVRREGFAGRYNLYQLQGESPRLPLGNFESLAGAAHEAVRLAGACFRSVSVQAELEPAPRARKPQRTNMFTLANATNPHFKTRGY